jgi:putative hydrolase of the HAD superfamily
MFLYFDLGKVLLDFDVEQMCRQMGEVAGCDPAKVRAVVFESDLQARYERGEIDNEAFYDGFCRATATRPDRAALLLAGSDIFQLNVSMLPVVAQLQAAGHRLGILSNTCAGHWEHCLSRYRILQESFDVYALSYELKAAKPHPEIFLAAAKLAGVEPGEIFYTDDIEGHVAGARAVGFDAVVYTSTSRLVADLRQRGFRFNY